MSVHWTMPDGRPSDGPTPIPVDVVKDELSAALDTFIEGAAQLRTAIRVLDEYEVLAKRRTPASAAQ
jgi:hypothetical protein